MAELGVLYHVKDGTFIQPVERGTGYSVDYTDGQLYGFCDAGQVATPEQLAIRGLAFALLPEDYNPKTHRWNPASKQMEPSADTGPSASETARNRMRTLANKEGRDMSVQERDELDSLIARKLLGDI